MTTSKPSTSAKKTTAKPRGNGSASGAINPRAKVKDYRNLPWAEIELKFIRGYPRFNPTTGKNEIYKPTIEDISIEYKLPKDVVHRASKKTSPTWVEKRSHYQARLQEQGGTEYIWRIHQAAMVDAETLGIAYLGFTTIKNWFEAKMTPDDEGNMPRLSGKEIADIASAANNFQNLARKALSEPVDGDPELRAAARNGASAKPSRDLAELTNQAKILLSNARKRHKLKAEAIKTIAGDDSVQTIDGEVLDSLTDEEIIELSEIGEDDGN